MLAPVRTARIVSKGNQCQSEFMVDQCLISVNFENDFDSVHSKRHYEVSLSQKESLKRKAKSASRFWYFAKKGSSLNSWPCLFLRIDSSIHQTMPNHAQGSKKKKKPVQSSGTSRFFLQARNFLSLLAPWARTQASCSPTKFLITILRREGKF